MMSRLPKIRRLVKKLCGEGTVSQWSDWDTFQHFKKKKDTGKGKRRCSGAQLSTAYGHQQKGTEGHTSTYCKILH